MKGLVNYFEEFGLNPEQRNHINRSALKKTSASDWREDTTHRRRAHSNVTSV